MIAKYPNDPNKRVKSARIDSGDLARGYKKLRKALDAAGKTYVKLVASNSLDEKKMADMETYENARFDSYGVGENLITSASDPVMAFALKAYPQVTKAQMKEAEIRFYNRFFHQQFKRSCLPDGPKVGSLTLSPRGDWRMPSDASAALWIDAIKKA